jgi:hypothetical protein
MIIAKSKESYSIALRNISNRGMYAIETKGQRKYIIQDQKRLMVLQNGPEIRDLHDNQDFIKPLFKAVRSSVTKAIKKYNFNVPAIERKYPCCFFNKEIWDQLAEGTIFYHIDASHCYWRVAYILGYIKKGLYLKYAENRDLKMVRNISLAVLNSRLKRDYYIRNEKINEIICDTSLYSLIYNNIRYFTYNNSGEVQKTVPKHCISYRIDGICVTKEGISKAKKVFEKNGLLYKVTRCIKVDEKYYSTTDGELKKIS